MRQGDILVKQALKQLAKKTPDHSQAFKLLEKAAAKSNAEALYAIGTWYLHGTYVKRKPALAVDFLLKATEQNHAFALFDLAVCYEKGVGVKRNKQKAFESYLRAALLGDKQAVYEVGRCYYYAIGVTKNIRLAKIWLDIAAF